MNRERLERELAERFGGEETARRVVSRQARDLADSGQLAADLSHSLTPGVVVSNLADAPEDHSLVERWNWWIGSLELSHGGYQRFQVRRDVPEE
ncbi:hypothetical protein ACKVMT_09270 [Halobacteriales archaeon Cl-PHB]